MTTTQLLSILGRLNKNPDGNFYTKFQISKNVDYAHVWDDKEDYRPKIFFLIKHAESYIGIVLDMSIDLHWVMHPAHRKQGHLTNALQTAILPYLFDIEMNDEVRISIDEKILKTDIYNSSLSVAEKVGFKRIGDKIFILTSDNYNCKLSELDFNYVGMKRDEVIKVKQQLTIISKKINYLHSKIIMSFGKETSDYMILSLKEISSKVDNYKYVINDICNDYNNSSKKIEFHNSTKADLKPPHC